MRATGVQIPQRARRALRARGGRGARTDLAGPPARARAARRLGPDREARRTAARPSGGCRWSAGATASGARTARARPGATPSTPTRWTSTCRRSTVWRPTSSPTRTRSASPPTRAARCWSTSTTRALEPPGWARLRKPALAQPEDSTLYELHVRDFSITDETVPEAHRGTFLAFTAPAQRRHAAPAPARRRGAELAAPAARRTTSRRSRRTAQRRPSRRATCRPSRPTPRQQQACIAGVRDADGFNWGYDPLHYTTPEGSYATDPDGPARTREFRAMVRGINRAGLRVVMDVVYNHTPAAGQDPKSMLDRVVPGYYHRLNPATGAVETSHLLLEHRHRAPDDGEADGRLGGHLGARVQGRRLPLRPDGPPLEGEHARRARGARRADARATTAWTAARSTSTARAGTSARWRTTRASCRPRSSTWRARASARSPTACATRCAAAARSTRTRASRASLPASSPTRTATR